MTKEITFWDKQYTFKVRTLYNEDGEIIGRQVAIIDNYFKITRMYHTKYDLVDIGDIIIMEAEMLAKQLSKYQQKIQFEEKVDKMIKDIKEKKEEEES